VTSESTISALAASSYAIASATTSPPPPIQTSAFAAQRPPRPADLLERHFRVAERHVFRHEEIAADEPLPTTTR